MRVLIGGGSGFVGRHVQHLLKLKGYQTTLISRNEGRDRMTWKDLYQTGLPQDCIAVVNLAGENLMNPAKRWNADFHSALLHSRVDTTKQLAEAIIKARTRPKVWVSASAIGYYPPHGTAEYTEESKGGTGDVLAELCSKWEKAAKLPADIKDVRHVIVRLGVVLGRDGGMIQQIYVPFFMGVGGRIGSGKQWFPWVHVQDVAGIIHHAISNDSVTGVLNAVAPESATNADFTREFAGAMWRPAIFPVPETVIKLVYGAERARAVLEGQKVLPKRTLESGYKFSYPDLKSACNEFSRHMDLRDIQ